MALALYSILFTHRYMKPYSSSHGDISSLSLHLESISKILGKSLGEKKKVSKNLTLLIKSSNNHYCAYRGTQICLYIFKEMQ